MKEKKTAKGSKNAPAKKPRFLKIKLVRSLIGYPEKQRAVAKGLGLRKINSEVVRPEIPEILGMIRKISHVVNVDVLEEK